MKTSDFDYRLPPELIAQTPMEPRDSSRLMTLDRRSGEVRHRRFYDLPSCLRAGDLLVFNDTRVFPARLYGRMANSTARVELLLLARIEGETWRALARPGRRLRAGARFVVGDGADGARIGGAVEAVEASGARVVRFDAPPPLANIGVVPLPPYIRQALPDSERYQTVYAESEGSVAAPTAGLHFTTALMDTLRRKGIEMAFVTLHVGWDSFRPLRSEDPAEHEMHSEQWALSASAAAAICRARAERRRIIAVGTTAVRLLENAALCAAASAELVSAGAGWVDLFITPGFEFRAIDGLITNFHLPRSTLLMLVSAFAGRRNTLAAYRAAVCERYRFYSFGDAMLIA